MKLLVCKRDSKLRTLYKESMAGAIDDKMLDRDTFWLVVSPSKELQQRHAYATLRVYANTQKIALCYLLSPRASRELLPDQHSISNAGCVVCTWVGGVLYALLMVDEDDYWQIPGGRVQELETQEQCAMRMLQEETSVQVSEDEMTELLRFEHSYNVELCDTPGWLAEGVIYKAEVDFYIALHKYFPGMTGKEPYIVSELKNDNPFSKGALMLANINLVTNVGSIPEHIKLPKSQRDIEFRLYCNFARSTLQSWGKANNEILPLALTPGITNIRFWS